MSKLKKYFRQIFCIVGFLLLALVFAFNPVLSANAGAQTLENAFAAVNLPISTVDLSDEDETNNKLVIPLLSATNSTYTIRVTDPSGRTHDLQVSSGSATADDYFKVDASSSAAKTVSVENLTNGNYSITYIYQNGGKTYYSYPYAVKVKGVNFELSFVEPEKTAQGAENKLAGKKILVPERAGDDAKITLPDAYVKIVGTDNFETDEQDHTVLADFVVEKDGAQIYSSVDKNDCPSISQINDANSEYNGKWQLTTDLGDEDSATYRVIYKYPHGDTIPTKTFTIEVSKDYGTAYAPKKLTVNATDLPSMELGQKGIELPEWTASSEKIANIDTNIVKIHIEKEGNSAIYCDLTNNNRTFDFTKENFHAQTYKEMVGNYTITYELESGYKDANNNNLTASLKKTILSVTDSSAPTVHMAYSYEIADGKWATTDNADGSISQSLQSAEGKSAHVQTKKDKDGNDVPDVNTDYAVELKANYGYGELVFPAIYAEDLVNTYGEFEFYRYFVNVNDFNDKFYIDNIKLDQETNTFKKVEATERGYNASGDENIGQFNRIVRFKFNASSTNKVEYFAGKTYALHYYVRVKDTANFLSSAQEANVYETGVTNYKFQVLNRVNVGKNAQGSEDVEGVSKELSIKIKDLVNNSSINKNDKLSIKVEAKDELDKRVKNAVFYYTGDAKASVKTDIETALNTLLLNETWNKYKEDGTPDTDTLTNKDYFTNLKSNVLYNDGFVTAMKGGELNYTGFARLDEVDNENFETQLNLSNVEKINIVAVTINDNNDIAVATKTLRVNKTDETNAPVAGKLESDSVTLKTEAYDQGETVVLPSVTFTDEEDSALSVSAKYYVLTAEDDAQISEGKYPVVAYTNLKHAQYTQKGNVMTISNAQIVTSKVGTYYVVFTAIDDAGNQTFLNYTFTVEDSSEPVLTVTPKGEFDSISGTSIKAETNSIITFEPTVMKGDEDLTASANIIISAVGQSYGYTAIPAGKGSKYALLFEEEDEYTVTITLNGEGEEVIDKQVYYVTVSQPKLAWDFEITESLTADKGEDVELPNLTATFGKSKLPVAITVTVTDPDGKVPEWGDAKQNAENRWVFKTNDKLSDATRSDTGVYKVTYKATCNGQTITQTVEVKVGDKVKPEFRFANDVSVLEEDIVYTGDTIEYIVDLKRYGADKDLVIKAFCNGKTLFEVDTGLSIWDKDGSGKGSDPIPDWYRLNVEFGTTDGEYTENKDSDYANAGAQHYDITKVGKYTLTLTVTDSNSNTQTKEFSFNVVAKSEAKETNDNVVGIVLIVVSVLVLVGVILFFALTGKKNGGSKTRKTKKAETETEKVEAETAKETDTDAKSGDVE